MTMNGLGKPPGRSRPTNNQLLYKAHFRWKHYTSPLPGDMELPEGTQACASVTSAFLQVLATIQAIEAARLDRPRNVLRILATNTRRTKVVELSSGTHRVAEELRRHSLPDGEGGQYSTNLDRNRYGSDNNYLFTVTRYNLECLGLCPCLVDIEIMDTRNGNEVQIVAAGLAACACDSAERRERADASTCADSGGGRTGGGTLGGVVGGNLSDSPIGVDGRRPGSAGGLGLRDSSLPIARERDAVLGGTGGVPAQVIGMGMGLAPVGGGMRRAPSAGALRRAPSGARLAEHSRVNSGGSELFDALLAAANDTMGGDGARGERVQRGGGAGSPDGTARRAASSGLAPLPGRGRLPWNQSFNEVDSLQNAIDAFRGEDEVGTSLPRVGSRTGRRMLRRNSVSMIIENPVLAQTGAGESLLLGPGYGGFPSLAGGISDADLVGAGGPARSAGQGVGPVHAEAPSGGANEGTDEAGGNNLHTTQGEHDDHQSFRSGLLRTWHRSASALNLARSGAPTSTTQPSPAAAELRALREEVARLEGRLEESRANERAAAEIAAGLNTELRDTRAAARKAALVMRRLRDRVAARKTPMAANTSQEESLEPKHEEGTQGESEAPESALDAELAAAAAGLLTEEDLASVASAFLTGEAELEMLRGELAEARAACAKAVSERAEAEERLRCASASPAPAAALRAVAASAQGGHSAVAIGSPAAGRLHAPSPPLPPGQHPLLPLFGTAPLNPYGGMHASAFRPPLASGARAIHKVASMPSLKRGLLSPPEPRGMLALPRFAEERPKRPRTPIAEGSEDSQPESKRATTDLTGEVVGSTPFPASIGGGEGEQKPSVAPRSPDDTEDKDGAARPSSRSASPPAAAAPRAEGGSSTAETGTRTTPATPAAVAAAV